MKNHEFSKIRFKRFKIGYSGYPPFNFDANILDIVDLETYISIETNRIPLLIGTQFGVYPSIKNIPDFLKNKRIIAILHKSLLSGHVAGLGIYEAEADTQHSGNFKRQEVIFFKNEL